jgi:hypothetical protein
MEFNLKQDKPEPKGRSKRHLTQSRKGRKGNLNSGFKIQKICFSLRALRLCEKISFHFEMNLIPQLI